MIPGRFVHRREAGYRIIHPELGRAAGHQIGPFPHPCGAVPVPIEWGGIAASGGMGEGDAGGLGGKHHHSVRSSPRRTRSESLAYHASSHSGRALGDRIGGDGKDDTLATGRKEFTMAEFLVWISQISHLG